MRKLLILIVVLGVASMANATLQISVEGDPEPVDSEIWADPSIPINLDIHGNIVDTGDYVYYLLLVDQAEGSLSATDASCVWGNLSQIDYFTNSYPATYMDVWIGRAGLTKPPIDGIAGYVGDSGGGGTGGLIAIVDPIPFHCEGPGDAIVTLLTSPTAGVGTWAVEDTVTIHQIPEPITMALLGLGGLLLRRRK